MHSLAARWPCRAVMREVAKQLRWPTGWAYDGRKSMFAPSRIVPQQVRAKGGGEGRSAPPCRGTRAARVPREGAGARARAHAHAHGGKESVAWSLLFAPPALPKRNVVSSINAPRQAYLVEDGVHAARFAVANCTVRCCQLHGSLLPIAQFAAANCTIRCRQLHRSLLPIALFAVADCT
eukprot:353906-Chlamydomonas_euryale.AAC.5